ncbi:hypothetical protein V4D06_19660 [Vibrio mimicus]|uniref:DUF7659 family protein n=1 Tax=Vibrio mimicus TaxID=674 RepID=UPI002F938258
MKSLIHYTQDRQTAVFNEAGAFFAFTRKQFDQAKMEGVEYCHIVSGLICPVQNAKKLINQLAIIQQEGIVQDIQENGKKAIIRRELFNHECFYTNDIGDCVEELEEYGYTYDDIYEEFTRIRKAEDGY